MNLVTAIVFLSCALQLVATGLALNLIRVTGRQTAWLLITAALLLQFFRRVTVLFDCLAFPTYPPADLESELLGLLISVLLLGGIGYIGPLLNAMQSAETLLSQERSRLQTMLDLSPSAFITIDQQRTIRFFNRGAEKTFGYRADAIVGRSLDLLLPPDLLDTHRADIVDLNDSDALRPNLSARFETIGRRSDGSTFPAEAGISCFLEDGQTHYTLIVRDMTVYRDLEQQQAQLRIERERERVIREFLGEISHDLSTPLTVMNTSLYLLERVDDEDKRHHQIRSMQAQIDHLDGLVKDVIMLSRLDTLPDLDLAQLDINALVADTVARLSATAELKRIRLGIEPDPALPPVEGDEAKVGRAIANLAENALRYTPEGGSVILRTSTTNGQVMISVQDTGIGIEPADLPHIFDRFYRAESARNLVRSGTGIGLAIVKKVADLHGGQVLVDTAPGSGSTFRLVLPLARPPAIDNLYVI